MNHVGLSANLIRMKNLSLILNIFLLVAVAVLYYLHFTHKPVSEPVPMVANRSNLNIAFVNSDSLLDQYNYFKNKKSELEEKQSKMKNELKAESLKLQHEAEEYQQRAATMSEQERGKREEELMVKQQSLMQKKDDLLSKLDDEQNKTYEDLYSKLTGFMKEFNKKKNYSFILGFQKGGGILFANDSLNITKEVVAGLNEDYKKEQKGDK